MQTNECLVEPTMNYQHGYKVYTYNIVFALLSLVLPIILLQNRNSYSLVCYFIFLCLHIPGVWSIKEFFITKRAVGMFLFGILVYATLFQHINALELWCDEIGVINVAQRSFGEIASLSLGYHIVAPPLDYWNMWFWKKVIDFIPIANQEFFYRVPYMFIHTIGAILFSFLVRIKIKSILDVVVSIFAFLFYFFNPLLFFYSIEVRFYALTALGSVIGLVLYNKDKLTHIKYLPLQGSLLLNSIFFPIFILPFVLQSFPQKYIKEKKERTTMLYWCFFVFVLTVLVLIKSKLDQSVSISMSVMLIINAVRQFFLSQFSKELLVFFLCACFYVLFIGKDKKLLILVFSFLFSFLLITLIAIEKRYFDFHARHYVFLAPLFVYILVIITERLFRKLKYVSFILYIYVVLWSVVFVYQQIFSQHLVSKGLIGTKKVFQYAEKEKKSIVIAPNTENPLDPSVYQYSVIDSMVWYGQRYQSVPLSISDSWQEACEKIQNNNSIIFSVTGSHCFGVPPQEVYHINGAIIIQ